MTATNESNVRVIHDYLAALERAATGDDLSRFFTVDAVQEEFPNRLNPAGQRSDLASILERAERGRHLLASQRYSVRSMFARDDVVAVEAEWVGVLAMQVGALTVGTELRAYLAIFFELHQGRIRRQRNYDCFEPW